MTHPRGVLKLLYKPLLTQDNKTCYKVSNFFCFVFGVFFSQKIISSLPQISHPKTMREEPRGKDDTNTHKVGYRFCHGLATVTKYRVLEVVIRRVEEKPTLVRKANNLLYQLLRYSVLISMYYTMKDYPSGYRKIIKKNREQRYARENKMLLLQQPGDAKHTKRYRVL